MPTEFLNTRRGSLYLILSYNFIIVCSVCVAARLGVFHSFSRIRNLWDLRNISVPHITRPEFLVTVIIIAKFKERAGEVLQLEHSFVWC